jgi:3-carboxy-cis,cis-muconate cycloisomerase
LRSDGLFDALYARGGVAAHTDGRAWLAAMLDVEAALARACAGEGLIPLASASAIGDACRVERFDLAAIADATGDSATPVIAIVAALRAAVGDQVAPHVHLGATSQDIIDTAAMLVSRRALEPVLADAAAAAAGAAALAEDHRASTMAARTLLQQAQLSTFGLRAAGWLVGLDEASDRLREVAATRLAVQMEAFDADALSQGVQFIQQSRGLSPEEAGMVARRFRDRAFQSPAFQSAVRRFILGK